jgi:hypothetical protein
MAGVVAACSSTGDGDGSGGTGGKDPTGTNSTTGNMVTTGATMATTTATTTGPGTGGAGGGAECAGALELSGVTPACNDCLNTSCCSQSQACAAEAECTGLLTCQVECPQGDQACLQACIDAAPVGAPLLESFDDCFGGPICGLPDACNVPQQAAICDSGFAFGGPDMPATPEQQVCAECLGQPGCCEDFTACFAEANCQACLIMGDMAACTASALDEATQVCFTQTCAVECG